MQLNHSRRGKKEEIRGKEEKEEIRRNRYVEANRGSSSNRT